MKRLVIINPKSKNGKSLKIFNHLKGKLHSLLGDFEIYQTTCAGDCTERVRKCLLNKEYDQLLIAGGDGTINEAVNGYFQDGNLIDAQIPIGIINLGTGGDFIKTVKKKSSDYHEALKKNTFTKVDCGLTYTKDNPKPNYFINISSVGLSGDLNRQLKQSKFQFGIFAYFYHTLTSLFKYKPPECNIKVLDPNGVWQEVNADLVNFFVCNGKYNGGGMNWAPNADIQNSLFDLVLVSKIPKYKLILESYKVYSGKIDRMSGVSLFRGTEVQITSNGYISQELDGEIKLFRRDNHQHQIFFKVIPSAIPVNV